MKLIRVCVEIECLDQDCLGFVYGYVDKFLPFLYNNLSVEEIRTVSDYLNLHQISYQEQLDLYLKHEENIDNVVKFLTENSHGKSVSW